MNELPAPLISEESIANRVEEMGATISRDFLDLPLTVVALLKGGAIFYADLVRRISIPLEVVFLSVSSYRGMQSSGQVTCGPIPNLAGRHVLVVDDILDTGATLAVISQRLLSEGQALTVKSCVLLQKSLKTPPKAKAEYVGFSIPPRFVVGYGLDLDEQFRNMPYIGVMDAPNFTINLEYFDTLREAVGREKETWTLEEGATVATLVSSVLAKHPALLPHADALVVTSGLDYVEPEHVLSDGEKIGFLPGR